jgi:hypothetical protein
MSSEEYEEIIAKLKKVCEQVDIHTECLKVVRPVVEEYYTKKEKELGVMYG